MIYCGVALDHIFAWTSPSTIAAEAHVKKPDTNKTDNVSREKAKLSPKINKPQTVGAKKKQNSNTIVSKEQKPSSSSTIVLTHHNDIKRGAVAMLCVLLLLSNLPMAAYFSYIHQRGPLDLVRHVHMVCAQFTRFHFISVRFFKCEILLMLLHR